MENTYYIYHIPTIKIGVSTEPEARVSRQGFFDYEILEEHQCIYKVSDREQELQKQYGYKVDTTPYYQSRGNWGSKAGKVGGKICNESGQLAKICSLGGKISGKLPKYHFRKLDYQTAQYIRAQYARKVDVFGKPITQRRLAKVFGVDRGTLCKILQNKTYTTP